jgi:hypothetical protein
LWGGRHVLGPAPATRFPGVDTLIFGAYLDDFDRVDASFFGLTAREAAGMDPQQRLLMEVAWEALEDARIPPATLEGSRTSVVVGLQSGEYEGMMAAANAAADVYTLVGGSRNGAAGRMWISLLHKAQEADEDDRCDDEADAPLHDADAGDAAIRPESRDVRREAPEEDDHRKRAGDADERMQEYDERCRGVHGYHMQSANVSHPT